MTIAEFIEQTNAASNCEILGFGLAVFVYLSLRIGLLQYEIRDLKRKQK